MFNALWIAEAISEDCRACGPLGVGCECLGAYVSGSVSRSLTLSYNGAAC